MPNQLKSRPGPLREKTENYGVCSKCGCSWFEEVRFCRVDRDRVVPPGQSVPKLSETMALLRCAKCLALHEPGMVYSNNPSFKLYAVMLEEIDRPVTTMEGVQSSTVKAEDKKV